MKLYTMRSDPVNTAFGGPWSHPNAPDSGDTDAGLLQAELTPELTPVSPHHPQVIEGRVAQLAEQLTLNQ